MIKLTKLLFVTLAIALSGCAANVTRPTLSQAPVFASSVTPKTIAVVITGSSTIKASSDWNTFCAEWRSALTSAAAAAGLSFAYFESEPVDQPAGTTLVNISVKDYRYLTPGARFGLGVMSGNAFIDADAEFFELPSKRILGTQKYATSSSAWQGVLSAMTDKQVLAISKEIIQEVQKK